MARPMPRLPPVTIAVFPENIGQRFYFSELPGEKVKSREKLDYCSVDSRRAPDQGLKCRFTLSHPNLRASNVKAAIPRGLLGYAQTATHGRSRSVQISVHGSAEPRNSYVRKPREAA